MSRRLEKGIRTHNVDKPLYSHELHVGCLEGTIGDKPHVITHQYTAPLYPTASFPWISDTVFGSAFLISISPLPDDPKSVTYNIRNLSIPLELISRKLQRLLPGAFVTNFPASPNN
jgi:hypothetical protein